MTTSPLIRHGKLTNRGLKWASVISFLDALAYEGYVVILFIILGLLCVLLMETHDDD